MGGVTVPVNITWATKLYQTNWIKCGVSFSRRGRLGGEVRWAAWTIDLRAKTCRVPGGQTIWTMKAIRQEMS